MTKRQEKALLLKGNHKIYYEDEAADIQKEIIEGYCTQEDADRKKNVRTIADLDEVEIVSMTERPDNLDGRAYVPD